MKSKEGKEAERELEKQYDVDTFIFNEPMQFLIRSKGKIPQIVMDDFFDDIYLCHHNMKWTYVIPHEIQVMGPFFSYGIK